MRMINHMLLRPGPIRAEARRLVKESLEQVYAKQGLNPQFNEGQWIEIITVALWNDKAQLYLKRAKRNLGVL